ncbi:hypothetical protein [Chryseobacterium sp. SIMBA_038]|uniref:hypothetical protein n=1 Tax=Chryseobacterium sp. SIMBA_038 TaxID=3085780 RepID=UPI0039781670
MKIENLKFNTNEIRVYKKYAISTGLELFRFYQDDKENWKAELYKTFVISGNKEDKIIVDKTILNSLKNPKLIWAQILDTDVVCLSKWETFKYKLKKHMHDYEVIDGEVTSSTQTTRIMDGISYTVKIKTGENENEFSYSNPEDYLKTYPNVDELISFKELLDLLKKDFKIFSK